MQAGFRVAMMTPLFWQADLASGRSRSQPFDTLYHRRYRPVAQSPLKIASKLLGIERFREWLHAELKKDRHLLPEALASVCSSWLYRRPAHALSRHVPRSAGGWPLARRALSRTWACARRSAFATDRHRTVDDTPAGGGAGMVLKADVLGAAIDHAMAAHPGFLRARRDRAARRSSQKRRA